LIGNRFGLEELMDASASMRTPDFKLVDTLNGSCYTLLWPIKVFLVAMFVSSWLLLFAEWSLYE